jgi:membrane protein YqaA with SNARE-associated domain
MSAQGVARGRNDQAGSGANVGLRQRRLPGRRQGHQGPSGSGNGKPTQINQPGWTYWIPALGSLGVLVVLVYVSQVPGAKRWSVFATAIVVAGAAAVVGGVVGFLFGIPLTSKQRTAGVSESQYETNTNLEQVSDWLTKIIVGVGLVQVGRALPALTRLAKSLNAPLGGEPYSGSFGLALTISYALLGFLFLYLWSRTDFTRELQQLTAVAQTQIDKVESASWDALSLVTRQLNSLKGGQPPTQDELNQAVIAAPNSTRLQIFNQAEHIRNVNMNDDKALMALTIPVFYALIAADTDHNYHRNHGSLGWALKDKISPEWREAKVELTRAIAIRNRLNITGWRLYEANRAVCSINILKDPRPGDPTPAELTASIEQDLDAARDDQYAKPMVDPQSQTIDHDIRDWTLASGRQDPHTNP